MSARPLSRAERRVRISGLLAILGIVVEAATLLIRGPVSFLVFMFLGGALLLAGMFTYVLSLIVEGGGREPHYYQSTHAEGPNVPQTEK